MKELNYEKKLNINIRTLLFAVLLLLIYLTSSSYAWFTAGAQEESSGDIAIINAFILNSSDEPLSSPQLTYTGSTTPVTTIAKITTDDPGTPGEVETTIDAIVRTAVIGEWSGGLPIEYGGVATVTYQFNQTDWLESDGEPIGEDYVYLKSSLAPGPIIIFLQSITFSDGLPSEYLNETLTVTLYVEAIQANQAGVDLWNSESPTGWDPLT